MSMSLVEPLQPAGLTPGDDADFARYKTMNGVAVASLVLGLASALALTDFWPMKVIPVAGAIAGAIALRQIRRYPDEYLGARLAVGGLALSIVLLCGGVALAVYDYSTEIREGYTRIGYNMLQPDKPVGDGMLAEIPAGAKALDGKKVFIKGYAYSPDNGQGIGVKEFMLVRDKGDCCFGGNPKITDMIFVRLKPGITLTWSMRLQKLHGTFRVQPSQAADGLGECIYHLDAEFLD